MYVKNSKKKILFFQKFLAPLRKVGLVLRHINHCRLSNAKSSLYIYIKYIWFGLVGFYGISTIVGYLMSNQFYTYKQLYFKQFSLAYKKILLKKIQFSISTQFSSILPLYRTLSVATTSSQSRPGSDGNSSNLRHYSNLIIRMLSVIYRTLVTECVTTLQRSTRWILQPPPLVDWVIHSERRAIIS